MKRSIGLEEAQELGCFDAEPSENAAAQTTAQRQRAYKESMKEAGYVRLEGYVTREQREKYRQLGGDEWLRKAIDRAKVKEGDRG